MEGNGKMWGEERGKRGGLPLKMVDWIRLIST